MCLLAACQSQLPTAPGYDSQSVAAASDPHFLLASLFGGNGGSPPTLIKTRLGETLTSEDARLSFVERALSFPAAITQEVDGERYVSFRFGPSGLAFDPVAILSISVDKADLQGVNPWRLRIAVASDDREDWRVVGGIYSPLTKTVIAPVLHFSRYALCVE